MADENATTNPIEEVDRLLRIAEEPGNGDDWNRYTYIAKLWLARIQAEAAQEQAAALERIATVMEKAFHNLGTDLNGNDVIGLNITHPFKP